QDGTLPGRVVRDDAAEAAVGDTRMPARVPAATAAMPKRVGRRMVTVPFHTHRDGVGQLQACPGADCKMNLPCPQAARGNPAGQPARSGKNSAISRAADSGESEPWTRFWPISSAWSPRIEPGVAATGSVTPMI